MARWAAAPLDRRQVALFYPTLEESIPLDHPVRLLDELLGELDFSAWENQYVLVAGQPPIHPRRMAAGLLYGLSLGIRSSRKLEEAAGNRLDFIWLLEGRQPDHATFCKFRTQFGPQLKELFRQVGRVGIKMGLVTFNQMTLDDTDIRANNSRYNTGRRASLEQKLAALDRQVEEAMQQAQEQDRVEDGWYGAAQSPAKLPRSLRDLQRRQRRLQEAMANLQELEEARAERGEAGRHGPAVPLADPEARVLPNKSGGHAPNYTAVLAVDSDSGMILDSQVLGGNEEASTVMPAVQHVEESFQHQPEQLAADSGFNTGPNLEKLDGQGIEALMPAKQEFKDNPALRADVSKAVEASEQSKLPMSPQQKVLDKASFIYDAGNDRYFCPMAQVLGHAEDKRYDRHGTKGIYRLYQCAACAGCPLAGRCLPKKAKARRICRDEYEHLREQMARRMSSREGRAHYGRRAHVAETPNAVIKTRMNFRQFLLRGKKKVQQEWHWLTTAYNLMKLIRHRLGNLLKGPEAAPLPAM